MDIATQNQFSAAETDADSITPTHSHWLRFLRTPGRVPIATRWTSRSPTSGNAMSECSVPDYTRANKLIWSFVRCNLW